MWACAKGNIDAALTLYHWNPGPLNICNKDGHLPLTVARKKGHYNLTSQIEQLELSRVKTSTSSSSSFQACTQTTFTTSSTPLSYPPLDSPSLFSTSQTSGSDDEKDLNPDIPPSLNSDLPPSLTSDIPPSPSLPHTDSRLVRRLSEQVIGSSRRPVSKRYSVDMLPSGAEFDETSLKSELGRQCTVREANSEPRLSFASTPVSSLGGQGSAAAVAHRDEVLPDIMMQPDSILQLVTENMQQKRPGERLVHMDTGEWGSVLCGVGVRERLVHMDTGEWGLSCVV